MTDKQLTVQKIKQLCIEHRFDEAIAMTNDIEFKDLAIEAHLLCIESEQACIRDGSYTPTKAIMEG